MTSAILATCAMIASIVVSATAGDILMAKAIAYHDCDKPEKAALWAARLARLLDAKVILNDRFATAEPEC